MKMGVVDCLQHMILIQVIRIRSGPKLAATDINRICASSNGRFHTFKRTSRSKHFHLSLFHDHFLQYLPRVRIRLSNQHKTQSDLCVLTVSAACAQTC